MFGAVVYLIVVVVLRFVKRQRAPKPRGLCVECSFAHIRYGANTKRETFCTFGGGVRLVALDVLYCTDYRDRKAAPRIVPIGFARETASVEVVAEVATRDAAGLRHYGQDIRPLASWALQRTPATRVTN